MHIGLDQSFTLQGKGGAWAPLCPPPLSYASADIDYSVEEYELNFHWSSLYRQLRVRRALSIFKDVLLRTRRALVLYNVYGDSALLVLNRTSLNLVIAPFWLSTDNM